MVSPRKRILENELKIIKREEKSVARDYIKTTGSSDGELAGGFPTKNTMDNICGHCYHNSCDNN